MIKNKTMHLCNSCKYIFPACKSKEIEFGIGKGNNNVIKCNAYSSREKDMRGVCPNCMSRTFTSLDCGEIQCCGCFEIYHQ